MPIFRHFITSGILWFVFLPAQIYPQNIDRSVFSNAYYGTPEAGAWVLGETFIGDLTGVQLRLTGGFLQGDLLSTGINTFSDPFFSFKVFPNPFSQIIHIRHDATSPLSLEIRDAFGRITFFQDLISPDISIDLSGEVTGAYFLKYYSKHTRPGVIPIFKIQ